MAKKDDDATGLLFLLGLGAALYFLLSRKGEEAARLEPGLPTPPEVAKFSYRVPSPHVEETGRRLSRLAIPFFDKQISAGMHIISVPVAYGSVLKGMVDEMTARRVA